MNLVEKVALARKIASDILEDTDFMSVVEYLETEGLDEDLAVDLLSIINTAIVAELKGN